MSKRESKYYFDNQEVNLALFSLENPACYKNFESLRIDKKTKFYYSMKI